MLLMRRTQAPICYQLSGTFRMKCVFDSCSVLSRKNLDRSYSRYNFKSDPRDVGAIVVLSADESSYVGASYMLPISIFTCSGFASFKTPERVISIKERLIQQVRVYFLLSAVNAKAN